MLKIYTWKSHAMKGYLLLRLREELSYLTHGYYHSALKQNFQTLHNSDFLLSLPRSQAHLYFFRQVRGSILRRRLILRDVVTAGSVGAAWEPSDQSSLLLIFPTWSPVQISSCSNSSSLGPELYYIASYFSPHARNSWHQSDIHICSSWTVTVFAGEKFLPVM